MVIPAKDMGDFHQVIIDHNSEIVCWDPILLHDYMVPDSIGFKGNFSFYHVIECICFAFRNSKANAWLASFRF